MVSHGANHPRSEISRVDRHPLMAGISCCSSSALSSRSNFGAISLRFNNAHGGRTSTIFRKSLRINAEISYVNAEEAKKLVSEEGYSIVDVGIEFRQPKTEVGIQKSPSNINVRIQRTPPKQPSLD
ncbi:hypothetical protein E3N88_45563 [Mikania micrantha]|uniref:Uncharacterized protein n=1 Tax=Mikania micrantha TaxID=192012 RepID=A0A5N6L8S7_9ASTR|nr:hypothetical protein E3N88_45563 [Mikania micrantha]